MAQTGFTPLPSSPRRTIPRQSHSSKKGAKMLTVKKLSSRLPSCVRPLSSSSSAAGISGSSAMSGSTQKARARVPSTTKRAHRAPPSGLKWRLSTFRPSRVKLLLRLFTLA